MRTPTGTPARTGLGQVLPSPVPSGPASPPPGLESAAPDDGKHAWLQEALVGPYSADIIEYLTLARKTGGPILDLGSGAGRLAVPFARHGFPVEAMDRDPASLARLRAWATRIGPRTHRLITTTQADLADLQLHRTYQLVLLAGAMVAAVPPHARPALLREIATHLGTGGTLALDYTAHELRALAEHPRRSWSFQVPRFDGVTEQVVARQVFDLATMSEQITYHTERSRKTRVSRSAFRTAKWIVEQDDLADQLHTAGLRVAERKQQRLDHRTLGVLLVCRPVT
ncbi:class I SAM-dependent methyltransferase [Streptomyces sp. NPDC102274]|uniref:class I SAM-dependent methyltransferase n=1 Tax=Streptomyces sp. NPDC102274 TaxID=3366151 RepID=UPI0038116941